MKKIILICTIVFAGQLYCMNEDKYDYASLLPELKQQVITTALSTSATLADVISMLEKLSALHNIPFASLNKQILTQELMKKFPEKVKNEITLAIHKPRTYQEIVTIIDDTSKKYEGNEAYKGLQEAIRIIENQKLFHDLQDFTAITHILSERYSPKNTQYIAQLFTTSIANRYMVCGDRLIRSVRYLDESAAKNWIKEGADINYMDGFDDAPLTSAALLNNINLVKLFFNAGANPYLKPSSSSPTATALTLTTDKKIKELLEKAMQK